MVRPYDYEGCISVYPDMFSNITFENSPVEVEIVEKSKWHKYPDEKPKSIKRYLVTQHWGE